MTLPKLYRNVWLKIEWLKDECVNGEHEQTGGDIYIEASRVKHPDNTWFWKISDYDKEYHEYELKMAGYFDEYDEFYYDISCEVREDFDERNLGYTWDRLTIKQQQNQEYLETSIPF